jgi:hypothetical protein
MMGKFIEYLLKKNNLVAYYKSPDTDLIYIDGVAYSPEYFRTIREARISDRWTKIVTQAEQIVTVRVARISDIPKDELKADAMRAQQEQIDFLLSGYGTIRTLLRTSERMYDDSEFEKVAKKIDNILVSLMGMYE